MPITPIEMLSMAPKTQEATQYKHLENVKVPHEQTQISTDFNNQVKHNSMQPTKPTKPENTEYRYDAKEKGNGSYPYQSSSKKKNGNEKKDAKEKKIKLSNFDVTI